MLICPACMLTAPVNLQDQVFSPVCQSWQRHVMRYSPCIPRGTRCCVQYLLGISCHHTIPVCNCTAHAFSCQIGDCIAQPESTDMHMALLDRLESRGSLMNTFLAMVPPRIMAAMISAAMLSKRSAPLAAQSPTLSPTRSAMTAGFLHFHQQTECQGSD